MEATKPKQRTHCSVCGQKVVRQDMPYCIYCGNHFEMMEGGSAERKSTKNMLRLSKMPEHPEYADAIAATPPEDPETDGWRRKTKAGAISAALGVVLVGAALTLGWSVLWTVLGVLFVAGGGWLAVAHAGLLKKRLALPMMARAAVVTDRRSETELRFNTGITTYFFTLEFDDGNEAEFRYPGRGAHTEPLSKGVTGVAYTRGDYLISFRQVRV
jgi:hypothetical protein